MSARFLNKHAFLKKSVSLLNVFALAWTMVLTGLPAFYPLGGVRPAAAAPVALDSKPNADTWVTNGAVYAAATAPDGTTYIGGNFTYVGPNTGSGVPLSTADGTRAPVSPRVTGAVRAAAPDGSGGWYIGGDFTKVGAYSRTRLAHILADGSVDPDWNPSANNRVSALVVIGSTVYAGGSFTSVNGGTARWRLAAFDADTGGVTSWMESGGTGAQVTTMVAVGSTIYIGGSFVSVGVSPRNYAAAVGTDGSVTAWNPNFNNAVQALATDGAVIYAGGSFTTANGGSATRTRLAGLNLTDGNVTGWAPSANNAVYALAVSGSTVYAGGYFTTINGSTTRNYAAALDAAGAVTGWNPNANNYVSALAADGVNVYLGGAFTLVQGSSRNRLAAVGIGSGSVASWNPNAAGEVTALAVAGSTIYAGGLFTSVNGANRNRAAALDAAGAATAWNPDVSGAVNAVLVKDEKIYLGGSFTSLAAGGVARNNAAAVDTTGTALAWNPNANGTVRALADGGSTIYVGGDFAVIGGVSSNRLAGLDATTGAIIGGWYAASPNGSVQALTVIGSKVYVGGLFTVLGPQARKYLGAINLGGTLDTTWNPDLNAQVYALATSGGNLYAGGNFTTANGGATARNRLAQFDVTTNTPLPWNPGADSQVQALATDGSTIYAGGFFNNAGGQARRYLAALDAVDASGTATDWNPNPSSLTRALSVAGTSVYAGGDFTDMNGETQGYFARFDPDTVPPTTSCLVAPASPNGDSGWYKNPAPTVTLTPNEAGTTYYQWDSTAPAGFSTYSTPLTAPEGIHDIYYFSADTNNNTETLGSRSLKVDSGAPVDPSVSSPTHTTGTPTSDNFVAIELAGASDTVSGVAGFGTSWTDGATQTPDATVTLPADATSTNSGPLADGSWWFNLRTKDNAGNWTNTVHFGPFDIDASAPSGSLQIEGGARYTKNALVELALSSPDAALMRSAETTSALALAAYKVYDTTDVVVLTGADGPKIVFTQFKDLAGNESTPTTDSIILDTALPNDPASAFSPSHSTTALSNKNRVETAWFGAADALSGVDGYSYSFSPDTTEAPDGTLDPAAIDGNRPTIDGGYSHSVALKADGTVAAAGRNAEGQANVGSWTDIKAIAAGDWHTVGLKEDGTAVATGYNSDGQTAVSSWTDLQAVAASGWATFGLKKDGTVLATGNNVVGQMDVGSWTGIKAIAAGGLHTVGLKQDGTVVAIGDNGYGQTNVSSWTDIKSISAKGHYTVGLKQDGTVVATGIDDNGQLNVSSWTDIKQVTAGYYHTVGLKEDGAAVAAGRDDNGQTSTAALWSGLTAVNTGGFHSLGLKEDGTVLAAGSGAENQLNVGSWSGVRPPAYTATSPVLADGNWWFNLSTADRAGNRTSTVHLGPFSIETVPPVTSMEATPAADGDNGWYRSNPTITFSADETAAIFYAWGDAAVTTVTGPVNIPSEGIHNLKYYAVDVAGNAEATQSAAFKLDQGQPVDPDLSGSAATGTPINDNTIDIDITDATDAVSGVAGYSVLWSQDSTTPPPAVNMAAFGGTDTTSSGPLPDGAWWFNLSTKDNAGNWTSTANLGPFLIDTSAPVAAFTAPAPASVHIRPTTVELSGTATDTVGFGLGNTLLTIQRLADGAFWDGSDWGSFAQINVGSDTLWNYSLTEADFDESGFYSATVQAVDAAGNVQAQPMTTFFYYIDGAVRPDAGLRLQTIDTSDQVAARLVRSSASATDPLAADLTAAGYPVDTTLAVDLYTGGRQAVAVLAHGRMIDWQQTDDTLTVEARTISLKPDTATPELTLGSALEFIVVYSADPRLQGAWFGSNASQDQLPPPDLSDLDSLRVRVEGVSGLSGWAQAFLPNATLAAWGIGDPGWLSVEIDGAQTTPTVSAVTGGYLIDIDLGYSSHVLRYGKDRVGPTGTVLINDDDTYANSTAVVLSAAAADGVGSGVGEMRFAETTAALAGASYRSYDATAAFNFSAGDGTRTVYAQYKDAAGNESAPAADTIILDTVGPGGSVAINGGDQYTTDPQVDLDISSPDAVLMRSAETTTALYLAAYKPYNTTDTVVFTGGDGAKTVLTQFQDVAGNDGLPVADSIALDTNAPADPDTFSGSHTSGTPSNDNTVDLEFSGASDAVSGVSGYSFSWTLNSTPTPDATADALTVPSRAAAGFGHTVAVTTSGTVAAVGANWSGQTDVGSWTAVKAVAAGSGHTVGLKNDGTVVAAGDNTYGQTDVSSWSGIKTIAAGYYHTVGLKSDGTAVAVGDSADGETSVTVWTDIKAVAAGVDHTVGLRSDGTVVAVGDNTYGQTDVSSWSGIIAVAAGYYHTLGLQADGTVVAAGRGSEGQLAVSSWKNIKAIAAGSVHSVGLKTDGTAVAVGGDNTYGTLNVGSWSGIAAIAAGWDHTVGLKTDGTAVAVGANGAGQLNVSSWADISQPVYAADSPVLPDGNWYFNLRTKDGAGNWTNTVHVGPFMIDTANPAGTIAIKNGAAYANTTGVTLNLTSTDGTGSGVAVMRFSNDGVFNDTAGAEKWYAYTSAKSWTLPSANGTKKVWAQFKDEAGNISAIVSDTIILDTVKPRATVSSPNYASDISKNDDFRVSWSGSDAAPSSGIRSYDVQYRISPGTTWKSWKTGTTLRYALFNGSAGKTYYFRSRAKDKAGNIGAWSVEDKTVVPLNQSVMSFSGAGANVANSNLYLANSKTLTAAGSKGTYSFSGAKEVTLIATKGKSMGYADVYIGTTKIKTLNLYASSTKYRVPLAIKTSSTAFSGTLKIVAKGTKPAGSTGVKVEVDGLAIRK